MNIFGLLVPLRPLASRWADSHTFCIDPTCILWSKLAFDIYAGCQADGRRLAASKEFAFVQDEAEDGDQDWGQDHCHQQERPFVLVIVTLFLFFTCFLFYFSLIFCFRNYRYLGRKRGLRGSYSGSGSCSDSGWGESMGFNLFGHFSLTETIHSSSANAPRRAFPFCYLCI